MIVAMTGATGFIGRRLAAMLAEQGHHVRALVRSKDSLPAACEAIEGDLQGAIPQEFLRGADTLVHCAAVLLDDARMDAVNVEGTRRLIDPARGTVRRWVQLSSIGVYGGQRTGEIDESSPPQPSNHYERSKLEADRLVAEAAAQGAFEHVILRPSGVFGPEMPGRGLAQLVAAIDRGFFFYAGPPGAVANFVHVDNVAAAMVLCASSSDAKGGAFNLSDDITMEAMVAAICAGLGRPEPRLRLPLPMAAVAATVCGALPGMPLNRARLDVLTRRVRYPIRRIESLGYRHLVPAAAGMERWAAAWKNGHRVSSAR